MGNVLFDKDFGWEQDADGIVTVVLYDAGPSANTLGEQCSAAVYKAIGRLVAERDSITGVIITSACTTLAARGHLNEIRDCTTQTLGTLAAWLDAAKADFRVLETLGVPIVAAIKGATLSGSYELALACHHRIALDLDGTQVGLPEVKFGLMPGRGGVIRTVRLLGVHKALVSVLLEGQTFTPTQALDAGLIDAVAAAPDELIAKAKAWIKANPDASQPWDHTSYCNLGGARPTPEITAQLPTDRRHQVTGQKMSASCAITATAIECAHVDIETAAQIETHYLTELVAWRVRKITPRTFVADLQ